MKSLNLLAVLLVSLHAYTQDPITAANNCFDKADYPCAIDNYLSALNAGAFKEGDRHLLEYRVGYSYFKMKQYPQAFDYLRRTTISKPGYMLAWWRIGDCFYNTGRFDSAAANYSRARDLSVDDVDLDDLAWWMGNAWVSAKKYDLAIRDLSKVIERDDFLNNTDVLIADSYLRLGKLDTAVMYYNISEKLLTPTQPLYKSVKYVKGQTLRKLGKYDLAQESLNEAIRVDPKYALALWEIGILNVNKKNYPGAIEWYTKAFPLVSDSGDLYTLAGNIAVCYSLTGNDGESIRWYKTRIPYSRDRYKDYSQVARLYYGKTMQPAEAEKLCVEATRNYSLEPETRRTASKSDYAAMLALLGKIYLDKKDTAKAITHFTEALRARDKNYEANLAMGDIAWARSQTADCNRYYAAYYTSEFDTLLTRKSDIARAYARNAYVQIVNLKQTPSTHSANVTKALQYDSLQKEAVVLWPMVLTSGGAKPDMKNRQAALSIIDKAVKKYGTDKQYVSDLLNSKAVILDSRDTAAIRQSLEAAVNIYPENMRPWDNLLKYYGTYDNPAGVAMSDKLIAALKKKKDNTTLSMAYVYKGDFHWRLGNKEEAKKCYQEALVWDANNKTATDRGKLQ